MQIGIFGWGLGIGFNFGAMYFKPNEIGMFFGGGYKIYFPEIEQAFTPYILVDGGVSIEFSIFGNPPEPDSYNAYYLGSTITIEPWLKFSPELGLVHISSKYRNDRTSFGFNIALEIIF